MAGPFRFGSGDSPNGLADEDGPTIVETARPVAPSAEKPPTPTAEATEALPAITRRGGPSLAEAKDEGPKLGDYVLVARFPSSTTAEVFLGYKRSRFGFIRRAVVKWVSPNRTDFPRARTALLDEARALSVLEHPNIVSVLDVLDGEQGTALALEYVPGTDLRRIIKILRDRGERLSVPNALFIVSEVLRALAHAHAACDTGGKPLELVHRDVNPSNVLIATDGYVKLADFGTVLMQGRFQHETGRGLVKGKVRYLAPEYILDQIASQRIDLYSTGVMLFELLTGRPCFSADTPTQTMLSIVRDGLPYDDLRAIGIPERLVEIIASCTHREPARRPTGARAMAGRLEEWMAEQGLFVSATRLADDLYAAGLFD